MGKRRFLVGCAAAVALGAAACGSSSGPAGETPRGASSTTPASSEAGAAPRSGDADAGDAADTSPAMPVRADVPALACDDVAGDVYDVSLAGLAPMTMAARGSIVRCGKDALLDGAVIAQRLAAQAVTGIVATSETTVYRIAFRTYREDGVAGLSTARVYLPTKPRSLPLPVIAVAHPTVGIADDCAPSKDATALADVALPWAARGFAVIAPDYAGLGNEGVQGYTANHDTAHSLLDAARALRAMLAPGALDSRVLLSGFSQGGGAVLASQALAGSYGAGGDVVAAIVFAPQFFSRIGSFGYVSLLRSPTDLTISTGISKPVVAELRDYSIAYKVLGSANAGVAFPAANRADIAQAVTTQCQTPFGGYIQAVAPHVGDLFDDGFRTSMLACVDGTAGCIGPASQMHAWMTSDLVAPDPKGAPVLYVQGLADTIMPPAEEAACNIGLLESAGVSVQTCVDPVSTHTALVPRNAAFALAWGEAKLDGASLPACSALGMPTCTP
jgi:dienelactone hydrolase